MTCCQIFCKKTCKQSGIKVVDVMKLIPNLGDKTNYVLCYRDRQLYLSLRMQLTKIHRVLTFKQSNWMKKYIDFNTEKKTNAANSFEKNCFKLKITSVYAKTMKNSTKICQTSKEGKRFFKIHQQTNSYYSWSSW